MTRVGRVWVVVVAAVLVLTPRLAASSAEGVVAPPGQLVTVRVCTYNGFSRRLGGCTRDMRHEGLVSNAFLCSVVVHAQRPAVLRGNLSFGGHVVYAVTFGRVSAGTWKYFLSDNLKGALPLPGGNWRCGFSFGTVNVQAAFSSGGPTGPVVDMAVCSLGDTTTSGSLVTCKGDESGKPFPTSPGHPLLCSGIFVGQQKKPWSLDLVPTSGSQPPVPQQHPPLRFPFFEVYNDLGSLSAGGWACRFSANGVAIAVVRFTVAPSRHDPR